ncbi:MULTISPECIES: glycosyltransferase family 39 protein [Nostoc]|uniref:Glycosyltransferase family 39 protein n=1 Tax=Nostoc paludosum FACHB-159 TaxID=2692908 RepID=A0ABR8K1E5_9NOSO|nr:MULTISPECIES: glycosyltransferase family 39 protein [Nostoc]MBD2677295.1 glycosyltransferase family 39 protein [Nostoc sp. FACHB-857]MBD2732895.1 glycosyltransferase family 39 protein [Nostoc paludosum FACHB-159]
MNWENARDFFISRAYGNRSYNFVVALVFIAVLIAHLYQLDSIPTGLFIDESAIGYNAALIGQTGMDEHGIYFPTYFRSFNDYKAPIYIYAVALIFKLFGISEFNLRFTSFTFYILSLILTLILISKIFQGSKIILLYALISFGFLPHFFTVSRIAFEVISQLTTISATALFVWMIFHERQEGKLNYFKVLLCGLALGTSVYTYPTARILSFLMLISLWIVYYERNNIKKLTGITLTFFICLIPYILFLVNNPGGLTARFSKISYIYQSIPIFDKILIFIQNYIKYWSPDFLIRSGDTNLRHATGYGGAVFSITWFLFLLGLINILMSKKLILNKFNIFILINLVLSPVGAALTSGISPHALRSLLISYYILLISCYGIQFILSIKNYYRKQGLITCIIIFLIFEIIGYQFNYFIFYPPNSAKAMESLNFKESLQAAVDRNPKEVIFMNEPSSLNYIHLKFYSYLIDNPKQIPIKEVEHPVPSLDSCLLYYRKHEAEIANSKVHFTEYQISKSLNQIQNVMKAKKYPDIIKVRCYNHLE